MFSVPGPEACEANERRVYRYLCPRPLGCRHEFCSASALPATLTVVMKDTIMRYMALGGNLTQLEARDWGSGKSEEPQDTGITLVWLMLQAASSA